MTGSGTDSDKGKSEKANASKEKAGKGDAGKGKAGTRKAGKRSAATEPVLAVAAAETRASGGVADTRNSFLRRIDTECPHQVVLPRRQLTDDNEIMDFLIRYAGTYDMYVEDDYAAFVRYCFADPLDAEIFRARFEPKCERLRLAG